MPDEALKVELAFRDDATNSDKVYKLEMSQDISLGRMCWSVHFLYGRRNGALKGGVKTSRPVGYTSAASVFMALAQEKLNKGYRITSCRGERLRALAAGYGVPDGAARATDAAAGQAQRMATQKALDMLRRTAPPPAPLPLYTRVPPSQQRQMRPPPPKFKGPVPAPAGAFAPSRRKIVLEEEED